MNCEYYTLVRLANGAMHWPVFSTTPDGEAVALFSSRWAAERFRRGRGFGPEWRLAGLRPRGVREWLRLNEGRGVAFVMIDADPKAEEASAVGIARAISRFPR